MVYESEIHNTIRNDMCTLVVDRPFKASEASRRFLRVNHVRFAVAQSVIKIRKKCPVRKRNPTVPHAIHSTGEFLSLLLLLNHPACSNKIAQSLTYSQANESARAISQETSSFSLCLAHLPFEAIRHGLKQRCRQQTTRDGCNVSKSLGIHHVCTAMF